MPLRNSLFLLLFPATLLAHIAGYSVTAKDPGPWPQILSSIGLLPSEDATVIVARPGTPASAPWQTKVESGAYLILEGDSPLAASFGFQSAPETVQVSSMVDVHQPKLPLILEHALDVPRFTIPAGAKVFTKERWSGIPMSAGFKRGKGGVLWISTSPGAHGYERFPYILQALTDLGFEAPFRSQRTWAFFDYSYRTHVDLDYFAARWRKAGISALHVASWHFYEADPERDKYLRHLIEACHREGIQVYAWVELPHVSEKFWNDHPEWREKTAVLQDAALDWRKLMNLSNRDCFRAASKGVSDLIVRFNWDGVNLAELYFESLEGAANPARFTPMNDNVRAEFRQASGFDPIELWSTRKDKNSLRRFLDYRASLARRMQEEWLGEMEKIHRDLDIVLTHVDDRMDTGMRDAIGADSARVLPLLDTHKFTFLIEDPATVWNLGPQRYPEIARRYPSSPKMAIDINVVERYQDVYPTKQQTGTELFQLVHLASRSFPRVALYFENSILGPDLALLPAASSVVTRFEKQGSKLLVDSPFGVSVPWTGPALVDGRPWPVQDAETLLLPRGPHVVEAASAPLTAHILGFNGSLLAAGPFQDGMQFSYESTGRALARLDCEARSLEIDGAPAALDQVGRTLLLPSGARRATVRCK